MSFGIDYGEKAKLCYMDADSLIIYIETYDIYKDITKDVATRFDTSNYEVDRPLPKGNNKKVIGLVKDEFGVNNLITIGLSQNKFACVSSFSMTSSLIVQLVNTGESGNFGK